jgi:hypothetical protein
MYLNIKIIHNMRQFLILILLISFVSCKDKTPDSTDTSDNTTPVTELKPKGISVKSFGASESFLDAKLFIRSYKNGKFDFDVKSESYVLGAQTPDAEQKRCANSDQGQHIHLIVDKEPYAAKYVEEFDYEIPDGEHYILAFLSRSYHESIKTPDARIAMKATIKDNSIVTKDAIESPMLFYSRPKGTYVGKKETDLIMLDFYLNNVNLGTEYKVIANINGEDHTIDKWEPYYIQGLPMGKNTITLTLVDANGAAVDVPNNPVTREFELKEDPAEKLNQ